MNLPFPIALTVEKAIESVLKLDPDTRRRLNAINGKIVRINIPSPSVSFMLSINDGNVFLLNAEDSDGTVTGADTVITGSVSALLSLLDGNDAVYKGTVRIEGDIGVSQEFKQIIGQLDPDWQDAVSPFIGDGLTHRLDVAQSRFTKWLKRSGDSTRLNTSEYLQEEIELLAPNSEVAYFCDEVDELRAAADRLEARIRHLEVAHSASHDET